MPLTELFEDILNSYSTQLGIDNKTNNPYFRQLRTRIHEIFGPLVKQLEVRDVQLGLDTRRND